MHAFRKFIRSIGDTLLLPICALALTLTPACLDDNSELETNTAGLTSHDVSACTPQECTEPSPGMPNHTCSDGVAVSGPACVRADEGPCEWLILECPTPVSCVAEDCPGPAPGAPNFECSDGVTVAGPACLPAMDGACSWQIVTCPGD